MSRKHVSSATKHFNKLIQFRQAIYTTLGPARDALFELSDAVLLTPRATSFAEFSCAWVFRRRWPSVYAALQDGRPDRAALLKVYARYLPGLTRPVLAGDHTAWPRVAAWTLKERTIEHQPSPVPGNRPITIGQGYSSLVLVPEIHTSWALPLLHERIHPEEKPVPKASGQLRQVVGLFAQRPIAVWDSEYGVADFLLQTADLPVDKVIRLRGNLSLRRAPGAYKGRGPYPKHGPKLNFKDPTTQGEPDACLASDDPEYGRVQVRVWHTVHFTKAPACPFRVACLQREQAPGTRRAPKVIWIAWIGEEPPAEKPFWEWYAQRYPVDHWYRLAKGRLHWTLPRLATPEQADRWSDLMPYLGWELWLSRELVADRPLPWQKPQQRLTPGRVCQGMEGLLARIGTPAQVPKPRGKAPGWPKGKGRRRRERHEVVKKGQIVSPKAIPAI
jgi:hypothetical protein